MGLKKYHPDFAFSVNAVTPDEIDRYEMTQFVMPGTASTWWASAGTAGTSASQALVMINRLPDYPRNVNFALAGSAAGMAGTLTYNGYDQFGSLYQESISFGTAANGGTAVGTKVCARMESGTLNYGTAVGAGTPAIGFVPGTGCLLGLPHKISAATDVVAMSQIAGTGAITFNGGTIAGFVSTAQHAVRPVAALTGTQVINVWARSTYNPVYETRVSNLTQAV